MGDDGGNPLWIIAIIVIAFINWLSDLLKKRQELKRAERERQEYIRQKAGQPAGTPSTVDEDEDEDDMEPFSQSGRRPQVEEQLASFFESLTGKAVRPPEPEPRPADPVAQQTPAFTPPAIPQVSAKQKSASAIFEEASRKKRKSHASGKSVHSLLATPGAARQAFLLKEILDKPKGLQFEGSDAVQALGPAPESKP